MPAYLDRLDPTRSAMRSFVSDYYRQGSVDPGTLVWPEGNREKTAFDANDRGFDSTIAEEVRGPLMTAYRSLTRIPLMPELTEPMFTRVLQTWGEHVLNGSITHSWNHCWVGHVMLHFYRRITPPEYQTRAHMQIVYAAIAAFDMPTTNALWVDDPLDEDETRNGHLPWHRSHPRTVTADSNLIVAAGKHVLRFVVPDNHPMKQEILAVYDDYVIYCANYAAVAQSRAEMIADKELRDALHYPMDSVTQETYRGFNAMRGGFWLAMQRQFASLLAGYRDIASTAISRQLYLEHSCRAIGAVAILDDVCDTIAFDISLPTGLSINEYVPYVTDDMMREFLVGDTHHVFLLASLEQARGQSLTVQLTDDEKSEIMTILRECYWSKEQGIPEDPKVKDTRIRRLCAMFLKYDIHAYSRKDIMWRELEDYFAFDRRIVEQFNMPTDTLSHIFGSIISAGAHPRPDHVAAKVDAVMSTPNSEMNEREKMHKMIVLLKDL